MDGCKEMMAKDLENFTKKSLQKKTTTELGQKSKFVTKTNHHNPTMGKALTKSKVYYCCSTSSSKCLQKA